MKTCTRCGEEKDRGDFYRNKKHKDKLSYDCKLCNKARSKEWRLAHQEAFSRAQRRWAEDNRAKRCEHSKRWNTANPEKIKAYTQVRLAIKRGDIVRGACSVCGLSEGVQAHHEDYTKPLDITWLCREHHYQTHATFADKSQRN